MNYTYSISNNFTNGVDTAQLHVSINSNVTSTLLEGINTLGDVLTVVFSSPLPKDDVIKLNNIISDHIPQILEEGLSSRDNSIVRFDGNTGVQLQSSHVLINDNNITGATNISSNTISVGGDDDVSGMFNFKVNTTDSCMVSAKESNNQPLLNKIINDPLNNISANAIDSVDIDIQSLTNGDVLSYDSDSTKWINRSLAYLNIKKNNTVLSVESNLSSSTASRSYVDMPSMKLTTHKDGVSRNYVGILYTTSKSSKNNRNMSIIACINDKGVRHSRRVVNITNHDSAESIIFLLNNINPGTVVRIKWQANVGVGTGNDDSDSDDDNNYSIFSKNRTFVLIETN